MIMDTELIAIGISLLFIIICTLSYLYRIEKKLDMLICLANKFCKKDENTDHTNGIQPNHQHSLPNTIRSYIKKCINNLVKKIPFYDKKRNWLNNIQLTHYTAKQLRLDRTGGVNRLPTTIPSPCIHLCLFKQ